MTNSSEKRDCFPQL